MKIRVVLICICMSLLLTACSNISNNLSNSSTKGDDIKKFNSYIELLNFKQGWLSGVAKFYFNEFGTGEEINIKKEFSGFILFPTAEREGEKSLYGFHKERHTKLPRKYQADRPSYGEIDAKMLTLCDKTDAFIELYFKDVTLYYADKEYEKDNFAKGRELHKKMVLSYRELSEAADDFSTAFYPKMVEHEGAELPGLKKKGFNIHYYALSVLLSGREISHMFDTLESEGKDFLEADLAQYEEVHNKFNSNVSELKKIYKDKDQLKREGYSADQVPFLNQFVNTTEGMQTAATDTLNMIKAGTTEVKNENTGKFTTSGRSYPVGEFRRRLGQLVDEYNNSISE
jgi:hypothetical protein